MPVSVLTKKWQTTIPKDIRSLLGLKPSDKILYLIEGKRVILKPLKGNILDLRGSVTAKEKPVDFKKLRADTKKKVARKGIEELYSYDKDYDRIDWLVRLEP
ncbi:MAG: AbrB/MazE/SpoVT family DNA-binding domain-containing protein [Deltaproteobacteria bacterium]|nr:AbrB/MazE/SpoVT family DNA-binding domain-containing protein [Deltaproteobacteria bacterium]MBW2020508.1 AbrB/MazE/SpoVT family DNA-binding domain-containing protein [Deltaproteobacteria bacterium]MBW2075453.1 AbrB/MazE/SpoVT family DNA-binding domain-containing protein [Deltaproteobacteria bacterium]RLB83464.1 MAG: AbrB/MazE/SpoVT family DNA-binding domain-containing protein [Deltaproteobacteria bacterium]